MSNSPDSISSGSAHYNNPYSIDPAFRKAADRVAVDQKRRLDSIESQQQKIERDLQNQFLNNMRLPPGSVVLAFQVGRFLVLAILLPPFYVVYKVPKWLILQAKPYLEAGLEKGQELLKLSVSFLILNLKNLFEFSFEKPFQAFQKLLKKLVKPKSETPSRIIDLPKVILKAIAKPFHFIAGQLSKVFAHIQTKVQNFKNTFLELPKSVFSHLSKFSKESLHQFQKSFSERVEKLKGTIKPYVQSINNAMNVVLKKTQETFQNSFVVPVQTAYQFIQKVITNNMIIPLQTFIKETIQQKINAPIKRAIAAVSEPLKTMAKQVSTTAESIRKQAEIQIKSVLKVMTMPLPLITNVYAKAIPVFQANLKAFTLPFRKTASAIKRIGNTLKRGVQRVAERAGNYLKEKMGEFKEWSNKNKKVILKTAEVVIQKIKQIPISLLQRVKRLLLWFKGAFTQFVKSLKIAYIWIKILVRYSFQQPPSSFRKK